MKMSRVPTPGEFAAESLEVLLLSLPPRRRLPSERLLCEKWGVSRGTLRTALQRLTATGRLVALGGSGYTVAPPRPEWNAAGQESLFETLRRKAQRPHGELLDVWEHSSKLPLPEKEGGEWLDVRALWCSERTPIALESRVLRYAPGEECDGRGAALLSAMAAPHSKTGPLHIGILRARKEEAALLSVPEGKALIQVRGFRYEDDGSLKENYRVILRPDRIRLLL